jgi:hypothetical protein
VKGSQFRLGVPWGYAIEYALILYVFREQGKMTGTERSSYDRNIAED